MYCGSMSEVSAHGHLVFVLVLMQHTTAWQKHMVEEVAHEKPGNKKIGESILMS